MAIVNGNAEEPALSLRVERPPVSASGCATAKYWYDHAGVQGQLDLQPPPSSFSQTMVDHPQETHLLHDGQVIGMFDHNDDFRERLEV